MKKGLSLALVTIMILLLFPAVHAYATLYWPVLDSTTGQWTTYDGHGGAIDIAGGQAGKTVIAAIGGTVKKVSRCTVQGQHDGYTCQEGGYWSNGSYEPNCWNAGTGIRILGDDGRYYVYAHLQPGSNSHISLGQYVSAGQELGKVGQTGWATGPHLHFAISSTLGGLGDYDARPGCENYVYFGPRGEMTKPVISTNKKYYSLNETAHISWEKTSADTDFYQYWLIVKNTTTNHQVYGGECEGSTGDVNKNYYDVKLTEMGNYSLTVYAVPHNDKETRQKVDTATISVINSPSELTTPIIRLSKTTFKPGERIHISWDKTAPNANFYQYWLIVKNVTTNKTVYGGAADGQANDVDKNYYDIVLSDHGTYKITVYTVPYGETGLTQKVDTKTIKVHNYTDTVIVPSCSEQGYTEHICAGCGDSYRDNTTIALGHTEPDADGNCTRCGAHLKDPTPADPQPNPNACKWCGEVHTGFFGMIVGFFHRILALFKR